MLLSNVYLHYVLDLWFIRDWMEKKVRRHLMRARKQKGFGLTRWLYETLKLFNSYKVR